MKTLTSLLTIVLGSFTLNAQTNNLVPWNCDTNECLTSIPMVTSHSPLPNAGTFITIGTKITTLTLIDGSMVDVIAIVEGVVCYGFQGFNSPECSDKSQALDQSGTFNVGVKGHGSNCGPCGGWAH